MTTRQYIEIIGLPGAGKTTVAKLLVTRLQETGTNTIRREPLNKGVFRRIRVFLGVCILLLRAPSLLGLWCYLVTVNYKTLAHVRSVVRNLRFRLLVETVIVRQMLGDNKKTLINDEGLIGKMIVLSLLVGIREELMMKLLSELLPKNTLVVYVQAQTDLAINRVFERDTVIPFFHEMDPVVRTQFYKLNTEVYGRFCEHLGNKAIYITNTGTHEELEKEIGRAVSLIS